MRHNLQIKKLSLPKIGFLLFLRRQRSEPDGCYCKDLNNEWVNPYMEAKIYGLVIESRKVMGSSI